MSGDQQRIIELQRALKIAKTALEKIQHGTNGPQGVAGDALYEMFAFERKQPLQGLVGHGRRRR